MSLIERAAKRLEELRQAGISLPESEISERSRDEIAPDLVSGISPKENSANMQVGPGGSVRGATSAKTSEKIGQIQLELDLARLAGLGYVTPDTPRSRLADEFRVLKRPLIANITNKKQNPIKHANLIMVTSSVPGEGKTFSAVNLALSLAMEFDRTVLLVDADVARPSLPGLLGIRPSKGLLDILENQDVHVNQVILHTNVERLSILPSGTPHLRATELLASDAMAHLLDRLSREESNRIVIFDSPPLLVTTEARVLATQMGQIVFVVHAESTLQSDVKKALTTIDACPIKLMVLNQARTRLQNAYGYGYGYGYGG